MAEQKELDLEDRDYINWLPDELILIILSKLDLSNGARTTILSTRWRNLWTFPTTVLRFDASDMVPSDTDYFQCYHHSMAKNIKLEHVVDQALAQYTGDVIDELNISYVPSKFGTPLFSLPHEPWAKVDTWVEFAKQKQVKNLSLSFELFKKRQPPPYMPSLLKSLTSSTLLSLVTLRLKSPPKLSKDFIESLLSSFPNLEELSIAKSKSFVNFVYIEGPSLKLKHLEIIDLFIGGLSISAPNLISFNFIGSRKIGTYIRLSKVPYIYHFRASMENLKQLKFTLGEDVDEALCLFFRLLGASPSLCKLWLNFGVFTCPLIQNHQFAINQYLVEVEIDGFAGFDNEVQLVMCIAQSSPSLKKIVICPRLFKFSFKNAIICTEQHNVVSTVQSLQSKLPQLELVII
ncbi:hypothetical protein OROMI_032148 [Orobanche minor]